MINWSCLLPIHMNTLTQYGTMAEKHWREHCPKLVQELKRNGLLHQMLQAAPLVGQVMNELTKDLDESFFTTVELMKQGKTAEQAQRQAWELVREKYILLPPEA